MKIISLVNDSNMSLMKKNIDSSVIRVVVQATVLNRICTRKFFKIFYLFGRNIYTEICTQFVTLHECMSFSSPLNSIYMISSSVSTHTLCFSFKGSVRLLSKLLKRKKKCLEFNSVK